MSKVKQYIEQATNERIRSRGLIRKVAIEAARIQRDETRRQAIEVYKQMCPSKNCKGCASRIPNPCAISIASSRLRLLLMYPTRTTFAIL